MSTDDPIFSVTHQIIGDFIRASTRLVAGELERNPENTAFAEYSRLLGKLREKWEKGYFRVAVLALVKSGKSTLINSFLGNEYLPAANTPETSRIVTVRCGQEPGVLENAHGIRVTGVPQINEYLRTANKALRDGTTSGEHGEQPELLLTAPLRFITPEQLGTRGFEILDTPGPNEAGTEELQRQVVRVLEEADVIVYLLDYTKLKTSEEDSLLKLLKEMRPELLRRCSERLFFAVNKIDMQDRNGLSPEDTRDYVARLLSNTLPGIGVHPDRIFPVSANQALLSRMIQAGTVPEKAMVDFRQIAFGHIYGPKASGPECDRAAAQILDNSGITHLESEVMTFIFNNRGRLLHQSLLEDLERYIIRIDNHFLTGQGSLQIDHQELEARLGSLRTELVEVLEGLRRVTAEGEKAKTEVEAWVRERFAGFERETQELIRAMMNASPPEYDTGFFRGIWKSIRELVTGEGVDTADASDALRKIEQVNAKIEVFLGSKFAQFQSQLEQEAHEKQRTVFRSIAVLAEPLARSVESKVNQALKITLTPINIHFSLPSLIDFQQDLGSRMRRLVTQQIRHEQQIVIERKRVQAGWCAPVRYENQPVSRKVTVVTHRVGAQQLENFWREKIRYMTEGSVQTAVKVLDDVFKTIIERASAEIKTYSADFIGAIEREIRTSEADRKHRKLRLRDLKARKGASAALLTAVQATLSNVEVPAVLALPDSATTSLPYSDSLGAVDVLIFTVLPEEFGAAFSLLENGKAIRTPGIVNTHAFHQGEIRSSSYAKAYRVVLGMTGVHGNVPTATAVLAGVRRFKPRYVILSGIAGGLGNEVQRGDVVVARTISLYEYGKLADNFVARPEFTHAADTGLLAAAQTTYVKAPTHLMSSVSRPSELPGDVRVHFGLVVSGEKIVDNPEDPMFAQVLRIWTNAFGVEMEGAGAAWAIHELRAEGINTGFLMVRGISDLPSKSSESGKLARDEAKVYAANVAASFVVQMIQGDWPLPPGDEAAAR